MGLEEDLKSQVERISIFINDLLFCIIIIIIIMSDSQRFNGSLCYKGKFVFFYF